MEFDIELFDKKNLFLFYEEDESGPDGSDDTRNPDSSTGCSGIQHFTNEGTITVIHECESMYLDITVYNSDNVEVGARKKIIDDHTFKVTLSPSIDGYIVWEKIK